MSSSTLFILALLRLVLVVLSIYCPHKYTISNDKGGGIALSNYITEQDSRAEVRVLNTQQTFYKMGLKSRPGRNSPSLLSSHCR